MEAFNMQKLRDGEFERLRDREIHHVGPLSLKYLGAGSFGPEGECHIETADDLFQIGWMDAEAMAFCIWPTADLWLASESDREVQPISGERRGWLRLTLTNDESKLGDLTGWKGREFQVGRLVMDAGERQVLSLTGKERTTDYRRTAFQVRGGAAKATTRTSFLQASAVLARSGWPDLGEDWAKEARNRWWAADETHAEASRQQKENRS